MKTRVAKDKANIHVYKVNKQCGWVIQKAKLKFIINIYRGVNVVYVSRAPIEDNRFSAHAAVVIDL